MESRSGPATPFPERLCLEYPREALYRLIVSDEDHQSGPLPQISTLANLPLLLATLQRGSFSPVFPRLLLSLQTRPNRFHDRLWQSEYFQGLFRGGHNRLFLPEPLSCVCLASVLVWCCQHKLVMDYRNQLHKLFG